MSFEPTIIIRHSDLESNREKLLDDKSYFQRTRSEATKNAVKALVQALELKPISFPELKFVIIKPELTSHNKKVREILDQLYIDYQITIDI